MNLYATTQLLLELSLTPHPRVCVCISTYPQSQQIGVMVCLDTDFTDSESVNVLHSKTICVDDPLANTQLQTLIEQIHTLRSQYAEPAQPVVVPVTGFLTTLLHRLAAA